MTAPWLENLVSHLSAFSAAHAGKVRRPRLDIYGSMPIGGSAHKLRLRLALCLESPLSRIIVAQPCVNGSDRRRGGEADDMRRRPGPLSYEFRTLLLDVEAEFYQLQQDAEDFADWARN